MKFFSIAIIAVAMLCVGALAGSSNLEYKKVLHVDTIQGDGFTNYFYRSNIPVRDHIMVYPEWIKYMHMRAEEKGFSLPDDLYIVDIILTNAFDNEQSELDFFPSNPDLGEFISWPIGFAGLSDAREYDIQTQNTMSNSTVWDIDLLPQRMREFMTMLHTPGPINPHTGKHRSKVFVAHCQAGCDRTGQFVIAYKLVTTPHITPDTLQELFKLNVDACGRSPNDWSVKATEWWCIFMRYNFRVNIGDCLNIADCKRFGSCTWPPQPKMSWLEDESSSSSSSDDDYYP